MPPAVLDAELADQLDGLHIEPTTMEAACAMGGVDRVMAELEAETTAQMWPEYRDDPVGFFTNVLGDEPWESERDTAVIPEDVRDLILRDPKCGQTDALRGISTNTYSAIAGSKGPGKTWMLGRLILWWLHTRPGAIVITIATSGTQVKSQVWGEVEDALANSKIPLLGRLGMGGNPQYKVGPKHYAIGLSPKKKETLQGWHAKAVKDGVGGPVLVIVDEASGVEDDMIEATFGCTTNPGSKIVMASNFTKAHGAFHDLYFPKFEGLIAENLHAESQAKREQLGLFERFRMTFFDCPEWVVRRSFEEDTRRRCIGPPAKETSYRKDVLCMPPSGEDELAFPYEFLIKCSKGLGNLPGLTVGIDIGRQGSDPCVATLCDNGRPVSIDRWSDEVSYDLSQTATRIAVLCQGERGIDPSAPMGGWGVPWHDVHIDATEGSLGVGVADIMWSRQQGVDPVSFSTKPDPKAVAWWAAHFGRALPDFKNNRQFLFWVARHALMHGSAVIPLVPELAPLWDELTKIPRLGDGDTLAFPKKDELTSIIGHSCDDTDSWILNFSRQDAAAVRLRSLEPAHARRRRATQGRAAARLRRRARRG